MLMPMPRLPMPRARKIEQTKPKMVARTRRRQVSVFSRLFSPPFPPFQQQQQQQLGKNVLDMCGGSSCSSSRRSSSSSSVHFFFFIRNCLSVIRVESRATLCKVRHMSIQYYSLILFYHFPEYLCLVLFEVKRMSARCSSCQILFQKFQK